MLTRLLGYVLVALFIICATIFVLVHTLFHLFRIPTSAMSPVVVPGEYVLVKRIDAVRRGDIIAFDYPVNPNVTFMSRVIAMPGETIRIRAKHVTLDGRAFNEPYVHHDDDTTYPDDGKLPEPYRSRDNFGPFTVPAASYFVMGDNRDRASDSRYWGSVPRANVRWRILYVIGARGFARIGRS